MSSFPQESYDQLYLATMSDTPVIFVEHRWMHLVKGSLIQRPPDGNQGTTIVRKTGVDVTIVATSYMVVESILAAEMLTARGISAEVLDLIVVSPLETEVIEASVKKTGRLLVADIGGKSFGIGSEIVSTISETMLKDLRAAPCRIGLPFVPTPTSPVAAADFYPRAVDIANQVLSMLDHGFEDFISDSSEPNQLDTPDPQFFGPY
jgi:pyruvate dehydrogenase E1 component beta subunit